MTGLQHGTARQPPPGAAGTVGAHRGRCLGLAADTRALPSAFLLGRKRRRREVAVREIKTPGKKVSRGKKIWEATNPAN